MEFFNGGIEVHNPFQQVNETRAAAVQLMEQAIAYLLALRKQKDTHFVLHKIPSV